MAVLSRVRWYWSPSSYKVAIKRNQLWCHPSVLINKTWRKSILENWGIWIVITHFLFFFFFSCFGSEHVVDVNENCWCAMTSDDCRTLRWQKSLSKNVTSKVTFFTLMVWFGHPESSWNLYLENKVDLYKHLCQLSAHIL